MNCQFGRKFLAMIVLSWITSFIGFSSVSYAKSSSVLHIGGSGTDLGTMKLIAKSFMQSNADVKIVILPSLGSSGAVKAVLAGKLEIGLASRPLKMRELNLGVRAIHYARTPLIFAVAINNPVTDISIAQLKLFYSGKINQWQDGSAARLVLRPKSDSDTLLLQEKYPQLNTSIKTAYERRGIPIAATDQDMADLLSTIPGALGTSTLALIKAEQRPIKPLSLNGVVPSPMTISNGRYPLAKGLYFVIRDDVSSTALSFLKYMSSEHGTRIFKETGHQFIAYDIQGL